MSEPHEPNDRWDCRADGQPWPCEPARENLRNEHKDQPGQLAIHMCRMLDYATPTLVGLDLHPDVIFERFIGWTKRVPLDSQQPR